MVGFRKVKKLACELGCTAWPNVKYYPDLYSILLSYIFEIVTHINIIYFLFSPKNITICLTEVGGNGITEICQLVKPVPLGRRGL